MLPKTFSFVDIETTGGRVTSDRIIDIGILRVEDGKITQKFESLVNPETYLPPFIEELTGIHADELENAPTFSQIKDTILELLADSVFVAHNVRFDYGFLRNEFRRYEYSYTARNLCTVRLSQLLFPQYPRHNLDSILERFNIQCKRRHRAFDDAAAIVEFYQKAQTMVEPELFEQVLTRLLKKPTIPPRIQTEYVEKLPESAGVYLFFNKDRAPLYVGKSVNIRDRVVSHFANDHTSSREMDMTSEIDHIETCVTAGELGALLTESQLIKSMQPLYNRMLRQSRKLTALKKVITDEGFHTVKIETLDSLSPQDLPETLAVVRSKRQARDHLISLVKKHALCEKLLGLHNTKGACFAHQLGWCKGACAGKEEPFRYNIRFLEAFSKTKITNWPFSGPIAIREEDPFSKNRELLIVDKWMLISRVYYGRNDERKVTHEAGIFDYDTYKILKKYIMNPINQHTIITVSNEDKEALINSM
jgi:DNA polymerase-3 subunit epsilon